MQKLREQLLKNLQAAIVEVEEHSSQNGVQTSQIESKDIDREKFAKDVRFYLNMDDELRDYYAMRDIKAEINNYLDK